MNSRHDLSLTPRQDLWDIDLNEGDWFHTSSLGIWHIYKTQTHALCGLNITHSTLEKKMFNATYATYGRSCKRCLSKQQKVKSVE